MLFDNQTGLYALLSLIPLIIIYFRRPKPIDKSIPSLMFIMKSTGFAKSHRIFRKLIHNLLFFIQLLALISLSLAVAVPYMDVTTKLAAKHTVIILDASASMQAGDRFDEAITIAKENLGGRNSIIVFSQNPYIVGKDISATRAKEILDQVSPTDGVSNLGSAMLAAETVYNGTGGRVVVISDFIPTIGVDPNEAKRVLVSKGLDVEFYAVGEPEKNIGIIDLDIRNDKTTAIIKNYDDKDAQLQIKLIKDNTEVDAVTLSIPSRSVETATFDTLPGQSMIELDVDDGLDVDNIAYISSPKKAKTDVLLITSEKNSNLEIALAASPRINLEVQSPPRVEPRDQQVFIFSDINTKLLLPGTPDIVNRKVKDGASAVIISQSEIGTINWFDLMPVALGNQMNESTINVDVFNKFSQYLQKGEASKYTTGPFYNSTPHEGSLVIASSDEDIPLIAIKKLGNGKSVYYGIEENMEFILSQDYPVFWNNIVEFLVERGDILDYNKRFTDYYTINITEQGVYNIQGRDVAMNLLDIDESDVSLAGEAGSDVLKRDVEDFEVGEAVHKTPYSFEKILFYAALFLFILEIYIIKSRGDI